MSIVDDKRAPQRLLQSFRPITERDSPFPGGVRAHFDDLTNPVSKVLPELKQLFRPDVPQLSEALGKPGEDRDLRGRRGEKVGHVSWNKDDARETLGVVIELDEAVWEKVQQRHLSAGGRFGGGGS